MKAMHLHKHPTPAQRTTNPQRILQIALGLIWLLDGGLQFQSFMFHKAFVTQIIEPNTAGQPGFVAAPIGWVGHLIEPRVAAFNALAGTLQMLIGLGLIYRRTVKVALVGSFVWALGVWWFGEGLGMLLTGDASPLTGAPGAVLLYAVVGLIVWPTDSPTDSPSDPSATTSVGPGGVLGVRGARAIWGVLWLAAPGLWLAPANSGAGATHHAIAQAPSGAHWLAGIEREAARITAGDGLTIAIVLSTLSAAIAIAVLADWHPRPFLAIASLVSLAYWVLGQGLGGVFTGTATDPNSGPLFVLLAAALWFVLAPTARAVPRATTRALADPSPGRRLAQTPSTLAFAQPATPGVAVYRTSTHGGPDQ